MFQYNSSLFFSTCSIFLFCAAKKKVCCVLYLVGDHPPLWLTDAFHNVTPVTVAILSSLGDTEVALCPLLWH